MKFKAIIISRKKIIFALSCAIAAVTAVTYAAVMRTSGKTVEVFKSEAVSYENILSEGLPSDNTKEFSIKSAASRITGLDFNEPANIISKYSAFFDKAGTANTAGNESGDNELTEQESAENNTDISETEPPVIEPDLPSKEEIMTASGLPINNATNYSINLDSLCAEDLTFSVDDNGPQVLVMHTHTTECYDGDQMSGETERTTDDTRNVIEIGNVICSTLEEYGIKTYHDTTYHDYPSYQGAYTRALGTISNDLAEYPSIKMVIDVHRDAFIYSDGSKLTVSCDQNGVKTAQAMLVCGSDSMGLEHPLWRENLKLAAKIQNAAKIMYPGLMRPVNLRTERFNMHMTSGSLLIEIGSNGNTLDEAKAGGRDVARAIAAVLKNQ